MAGILATSKMEADATVSVGRQIIRKRAVAVSIRKAGPGFLKDVQESSDVDTALTGWPTNQEPAIYLLRGRETQLLGSITRDLNILTNRSPSPLDRPILSERESSALATRSIRDSAHYSIVRNLLRKAPAK